MRWPVYEGIDIFEWHPWFAWHPVRLKGTRTWVWLETVERYYHCTWGGGVWEYRDVRSA